VSPGSSNRTPLHNQTGHQTCLTIDSSLSGKVYNRVVHAIHTDHFFANKIRLSKLN